MLHLKSDGSSIADSPTFTTQEVKQQFLQKQLELVRQVKAGDKTWNDVNTFRKTYGFPDTNVDSIRRSFAQLVNYDNNGWVGQSGKVGYIPTEKDVVSVNYDNGITTSEKTLSLTEDQIKSPKELLKAHGFDPQEFEIKTATHNKTQHINANGTSSFYSSRITVKQKEAKVKDIFEVSEYFKNYQSPKRLGIAGNKTKSNESLVIPLYDLHFGRLPDTEEFTYYDIQEEKNKVLNHVEKYIDKFGKRTFKDIYLVVGQDFLNSSFTGFTSSQSHLQSNAVDFKTMFRAGSELLVDIINMFGNLGTTVNVVGSLGNHDISEESALFMLLSAYYRNEKNVIIDDSLAPRKYYKIGNSCVGFGHLDKEGKRAFGLMQVEAKDLWAETKTHIFIAGHLHHFHVENENGVELYRIPAICPPDKWTRENGYVMNEPKTMCFIFDDENGLVETHFMYL